MGVCTCIRKEEGENYDNLTALLSSNNNIKLNIFQPKITSKLKVKKINEINNNINDSHNNYYEKFDKESNYTEFIIANNLNIQKRLQESNPNEEPHDTFSFYIFKRINSIRKNPQKYIKIIRESKSKISLNKHGILIYKSKVKVALNNGEKAFDDAIEFLKLTQPMNNLIYIPKMTIAIPNNEYDINNKEYLKNEVRKKIDNNINIKIYWKDYINDAETCFILTIVDDSKLRLGSKREDILNPNIKNIGISSGKIGQSFVTYFTLS